MAWDLRAALLKKGEIESARLDDFAFRERARTMRLLAGELGRGIDPMDLASRIAILDDEAILDTLLASMPGLCPEALRDAFARCRIAARQSLIQEIGDPTPHRLA
jgi:hypothetical protein